MENNEDICAICSAINKEHITPNYLILGNENIIRLDLKTGDIYVHGKLIENDKEVVDGMRKLLLRESSN